MIYAIIRLIVTLMGCIWSPAWYESGLLLRGVRLLFDRFALLLIDPVVRSTNVRLMLLAIARSWRQLLLTIALILILTVRVFGV